MPTYEAINPGFSTADAEYPSLEFRSGELHLRFIDWREQPVTAVLDDVLAFRWDDFQDTSEHRDDETYIVGESTWLRRYQLEGLATPGHKHFKLCFNEKGVLEALASGISLRS